MLRGTPKFSAHCRETGKVPEELRVTKAVIIASFAPFKNLTNPSLFTFRNNPYVTMRCTIRARYTVRVTVPTVQWPWPPVARIQSLSTQIPDRRILEHSSNNLVHNFGTRVEQLEEGLRSFFKVRFRTFRKVGKSDSKYQSKENNR